MTETAQFLNPVFTRVVNHWVIVVGLKGDPLALTGRRGRVFSAVTAES
jgi:hypothetical protein